MLHSSLIINGTAAAAGGRGLCVCFVWSYFFCNWESAKKTIFNRSACRDSVLFFIQQFLGRGFQIKLLTFALCSSLPHPTNFLIVKHCWTSRLHIGVLFSPWVLPLLLILCASQGSKTGLPTHRRVYNPTAATKTLGVSF